MTYAYIPLPKNPRVLFMGTPDFAVPSLRALHNWCQAQGGEVVAVVSQPDRPKGRGNKLQRTPVASAADELGLTCYQWPRLSQTSYDILSDLHYDLAVVIAYGKLLPSRYLHLPSWGCINLHASLLPAYRGAAPIQWAIIHGERETGVSVMRLDEGMDTGPVAHIKRMIIHDDDHAETLFSRLSDLSAEALCEVLDKWVSADLDNPLQFIPQDETCSSHAPMLTKEDGQLDWNRTARSLFNLIRGVKAWPVGQAVIKEGILKVLSSEAWTEEQLRAQYSEELIQNEVGTIIDLTSQGPLIRCREGALLLTRVQRPSKQATSGGDFCRGYALNVGNLLSES